MKKFLVAVLTFLIPLCLILTMIQSSRYASVESELNDYTERQYQLIEENKKKISAIAMLSSQERIEKIACENLKMRKAYASEIMRVSFLNGEKDK